MQLNDLQVSQFVIMLLAGIPPVEAVTYFVPEDTDPKIVEAYARKWPKNTRVAQEFKRQHGGVDWTSMTKEQRMTLALEKHYNEMAFYLYNNNYGDLDGAKKSKADVCREALEKKIAGRAGQNDPIADLYKDILSGKIKVAPQAQAGLKARMVAE